MVLGINLPDWKTAFQESFRDYVTNPLETKFQLVQEYNQKTQKMVIALGFGIFLLLAIAYFWQGNTKYLALGTLIGYLTPYIYHLTNHGNTLN